MTDKHPLDDIMETERFLRSQRVNPLDEMLSDLSEIERTAARASVDQANIAIYNEMERAFAAEMLGKAAKLLRGLPAAHSSPSWFDGMVCAADTLDKIAALSYEQMVDEFAWKDGNG